MNRKKIKKIASLTLCAYMVSSAVPANILAESPDFNLSIPAFTSSSPYLTSNGIVYNFIKEPGSVSLGEVSVGNNQSLTIQDVVIPNSITVKGKSYAVTKIEEGAFSSNSSIKTISFGTSIKEAAASSFINCPSLREINVSADNPYFKSINGVLYSASMKNLIKYPDGMTADSYTINSETNHIDDYAFFKNIYIKNLTFPTNVFTIGKYAFARCTSLDNVKMGVNTLEIGDYAFFKSGVQTINLSPTITSIGKGAFAFSNIRKAVIPAGLTELNESVFYNCSSLNEVSLGNSLKSIGDYAFSNTNISSVILPSKTLTIGKCAFSDCTNLKRIELNSILTSIGNNAFYNCSSIRTINLPKTLNTIGENAFVGCTSLYAFTTPNGEPSNYSVENGILYNKNTTKLIHYPGAITSSSYVLPPSLREISENAFVDSKYISEFNIDSSWHHFSVENGILYDSNKTTLVKYPYGRGDYNFSIPDTVRRIESKAFSNSNISNIINLPSSLKEIGDYAFEGCPNIVSFNIGSEDYFCVEDDAIYNKDKTELIQFAGKSNVTNFIVPSSVKKIREGAFSGSSIESIQLNEGLTSIGAKAFSNTKISEITFPQSLTKIGDYCFSGTNIKNVVFPESIKKIGDYSFKDCDNLTSVTFENKTVPDIENNAFYGCYLTSINLNKSASESKDKYAEKIMSLNVDTSENYVVEN